MTVRSQGLPLGAGLGSSASFSVAVVASCLRLQALLVSTSMSPSSSLSATEEKDRSEKNKRLMDFLLTHNNLTVEPPSSSSTKQIPPSLLPPIVPLLSSSSSTTTIPSTVLSRPYINIQPYQSILPIINDWSYASEILLQGTPSGLDNTTSCYGGLVKFSRSSQEKFTTIKKVPSLHIIVVNTKVSRSSKVLVGRVRALFDSYPTVVKPIIDSIDSISHTFLSLIDQ